MAAKKGTMPPNAGKGRPKGSKNKAPQEIKRLFQEAVERKGGVEALVEWASRPENETEFWRLVSKMLPKDVSLDLPDGGVTVQIIHTEGKDS